MNDQPAPSHLIEKLRVTLTSLGHALTRLRPAVYGFVRVLGQVLQFARRWILRILIVGLVLLPTIAVLSLLASGLWRPDLHEAALVLWVALSLAVAGGAWAILWILLRLFLR